jgi:hypothetical protein
VIDLLATTIVRDVIEGHKKSRRGGIFLALTVDIRLFYFRLIK